MKNKKPEKIFKPTWTHSQNPTGIRAVLPQNNQENKEIKGGVERLTKGSCTREATVSCLKYAASHHSGGRLARARTCARSQLSRWKQAYPTPPRLLEPWSPPPGATAACTRAWERERKNKELNGGEEPATARGRKGNGHRSPFRYRRDQRTSVELEEDARTPVVHKSFFHRNRFYPGNRICVDFNRTVRKETW